MKPTMFYCLMFEQPIKATSFVDTLCWRFPGVYLKPSVVRFLRFLATPRRHYLFPAEMAEDTSLSEIFFQTVDNCFALLEICLSNKFKCFIAQFLSVGDFASRQQDGDSCRRKLPNFAALVIFLVPTVFFLPLFSTPLCSCSLF